MADRSASDEPPRPGGKRDAADAVTWPVRVAAAWAWRLLLLGAVLYLLGRVALRIELVVVSFVLALFFTAVLHPLETALRRVIPRPRSLSAALALLIGVAVLAGIGWFVSWQISTHAGELADQVSTFVTRAKHWLQTGPLHVKSADLNNLATRLTDAIQAHQGQVLSGAIETVRTAVEAVGALLLILLSTFFLLRDGDEIWRFVLRLFPHAAQQRVDVAGRAGWHTLGGYMRGQLLIAIFHAVSITIVLLVLKVPLAAALGVLIFLGSFVPLIGLTVAGALCVAIALLEHGVTAAVVVAIAIVVLLQLEAHLLQPIIMSRTVEVHPLAIALAVITGTILAGIPGALLTVPFVAFVNTTVRALHAEAAADPPPAQLPAADPPPAQLPAADPPPAPEDHDPQ
jgi:putative heme transporter